MLANSVLAAEHTGNFVATLEFKAQREISSRKNLKIHFDQSNYDFNIIESSQNGAVVGRVKLLQNDSKQLQPNTLVQFELRGTDANK